MNWVNPMALWLLSIIPAIVALYFLKLKRREVIVSSTLLWSRVLEDRRVNSPFQRFKKSLLLLIQILAVLIVVGALAQPERVTENVRGRVHILMVDVSASMSVREGEGVRLELAKKLARDYIEALGDDERAVIIRFGRRAKAVTPVTDDRGLLQRAVAALEVRPARTSVDEAMSLALSIAKNLDDALGVIFSDGGFPAWEGGEIPLPVEYVPVGERRDNSGIVALSSRMDFSDVGTLQVFAEVRNFGDAAVTGFLSLYRDGVEIRAAEAEEIAADAKWTRSFDTEMSGGLLELRWEPDGDDALALDDRAWLEIEPRRVVSIWRVGQDNYFLDAGLEALPDLQVVEVSEDAAAERFATAAVPPDLILWDKAAPDELMAGTNHLFIAALPPGVWAADELRELKAPPVVSWDASHPVNRYLNYAQLDGAIEISTVFPRKPGTTLLLESSDGGLITTFTAPGTRGIAVGFDTLRSKWPLTLSFSFFLYNAIKFLSADEAASGVGVRAEELLSLRVPRGVAEVELTRPDEVEAKLEPDAAGWVRYAETEVLGAYRFRWTEPAAGGGKDETREHLVPVNLLDARESSIVPRPALDISGTRVAASEARGIARREYWPWLAALALILLLVEWYFYHRR